MTSTDLAAQIRDALREETAHEESCPKDVNPDYECRCGRGLAFAALRTVMDVHSPIRIYEECGHSHQVGEQGAKDVREVGVVCEVGYLYTICRECCTHGSGDQTEACVSEAHYSPIACFPCPTVQALARELHIAEAVTA